MTLRIGTKDGEVIFDDVDSVEAEPVREFIFLYKDNEDFIGAFRRDNLNEIICGTKQ